MVRQYVGARYVPKFADPVAWTSGTSYEAMTIVTYNNSSYTSKVPVPATVGNPADNPDYWALTGNYNAQVEQYRQEVEGYRKNIYTVINVKEFGLDNTGSTDNSTKLENLINKYPNGIFYFETGTYHVSKTIYINHNCKFIFAPLAKLFVTNAIETLFDINYTGSTDETYKDVTNINGVEICGGIIDCNNNVQNAINSYAGDTFVHDVTIRYFTNTGISIKVKYPTHCEINHVTLCGKDGNAEYGIIEYSGSDSLAFQVTVINCNIGYRTASMKLTQCTAWISEKGTYSGSIAYYDDSTSSYVECTADTVSTAWKFNNNATSYLINCYVINNDNVQIPSEDKTTIFVGETTGYNARVYPINMLVLFAQGGATLKTGNVEIFALQFNDALLNVTGSSELLSIKKIYDNINVAAPTQKLDNLTAADINIMTNSVIHGFAPENLIDTASGWCQVTTQVTNDFYLQTAVMNNKIFIRSKTDSSAEYPSWTQV